MAKKALVLDGLVDTEDRPVDTGIPQRGAGQGGAMRKPAPRREGEKRLTLALDGDTYRRLRMHAVMTDRTHQDILEAALLDYLARIDT